MCVYLCIALAYVRINKCLRLFRSHPSVDRSSHPSIIPNSDEGAVKDHLYRHPRFQIRSMKVSYTLIELLVSRHTP